MGQDDHLDPRGNPTLIERVQTGVRMEKRMVKVLKALAEYLDLSLGDLLEGIVLHAFESHVPFSDETLRHIAQLKEVYGMQYGAAASHLLREPETEPNSIGPDGVGHEADPGSR